jgi:mono/diheme cytochrome c family protein
MEELMALFLFLNVVCRFCRRQFGAIRRLESAFFILTLLCLAFGGHPCWAQTKEASTATLDKVKSLYRQLCQRCHAADGKGDPGTKGAPDFTRRAWHERKRDAQLIVSILKGTGTGMPDFRSQLGHAKVKELVAYVRAFAPAAPAKELSGPTSSGDFDKQLERLQKEYEGLQKQLKELTPQQSPKGFAELASRQEGTKAALGTAGLLFRRHCQRCHGADGEGIAGKLDSPDPPDFTRRAWQDERSNAPLLQSIRDGKKRACPPFGRI